MVLEASSRRDLRGREHQPPSCLVSPSLAVVPNCRASSIHPCCLRPTLGRKSLGLACSTIDAQKKATMVIFSGAREESGIRRPFVKRAYRWPATQSLIEGQFVHAWHFQARVKGGALRSASLRCSCRNLANSADAVWPLSPNAGPHWLLGVSSSPSSRIPALLAFSGLSCCCDVQFGPRRGTPIKIFWK